MSGNYKPRLEFQTPVLETRDQILQVQRQFFLCNGRRGHYVHVGTTRRQQWQMVGVRAGATRWRNDLVNAEQRWNTRAALHTGHTVRSISRANTKLKTMTLPPISFSFFDLHLLLWTSETTISPGWGELSPRTVGTHPQGREGHTS